VLAEIVAICLKNDHESKKHTTEELFILIDLWKGLDIIFLHPNKPVALACHALYMDETFIDSRLKPSGLVHLGYVLACPYLIVVSIRRRRAVLILLCSLRSFSFSRTAASKVQYVTGNQCSVLYPL
jgi:hypothetical protein